MALFSFRRKNSRFRTERYKPRLAKSLGNQSGKKSGNDEKVNAAPISVDWQKWRINFIIGFFCLIWGALWLRAWQLQIIEGPRLADKARKQHMASELVSGKRGLIYDRNGQILARSVRVRSIYANPSSVENLDATVKELAGILKISPEKLRADLSDRSKKFVWLKRKVDDTTALKVAKANLSGIGFTREYDRFYPFKHMAGQILGFVGMDDKGLEGIERAMEERLGVLPVRKIVQRDAMGRKFYLNDEGLGEPAGEDITLTLDMNLQFIAEEAMAKVVREYDAKWAGAIVVDVENGDILAWAQYPFFNPNLYRDYTPQIYRNRLASDALEPGSTFKPFVMAAALQEKKVTPNTLINCEGGKWEYKKHTIRDDSAMRGIIPASKVMRYSSNIGMAKIGQALGAPLLYKHLDALGFGHSTDIPLGNSKGIMRKPRDWSELDTMATSFGQSISVTGVQMAQAYVTLLNNGIYKPLRLLLEDSNVRELPKRVFNEYSVRTVLDMMKDVVHEKDGTGKRARIDGVEIGGKTGTAQKADQRSKTYGKERLASFVGFFPVSKPKFLVLVLVDEPTRNQYGGVVAAPAFKEIAAKLLTQSGRLQAAVTNKMPDKTKKEIRQRGLKLASAPELPWTAPVQTVSLSRAKQDMQFPGHLAKPSDNVPNVMGKSVRNAVELFARAGVVPELKGSGNRVVKQSPPPGTPWPKTDRKEACILWLSER